MSAAEQAIDKLRQVRERLPPEERSPDLDDLLATFEAYSAARAELLAARGATPPPGQQWGANAVERHPQLFRGLLHLLSAVVGAADVPLATAVTPELQSLLVGSALHVSSMTLVQMLVAALLAYGSSVAAHAMALHLCSQALEIVWPPDTDPAWSAAERQLPRRAWLPAFPDAASAAAAAAQQPLSAAACALDADLRAHCPDVTLGALRCLALQLRLMVLGHLGKTQHPSRERLALQQQSLIDCQMLMSLGAAGRPSADVKAASNAAARLLVYLHGELLLFSSQPELVPAGRGAEALAAEALRRTVADRRWLSAASHTRSLASLYFGAVGRRISILGLREALLQRAEQLLAEARSYLPRLRPWLPRLQMQAMESYQRRFEEHCAGVRRGTPVHQQRQQLPYLDVLETAKHCTQCGTPAPTLRKCERCRAVTYCSRECQKKHWKAGHKRECAALAQQRAAAAGSSSAAGPS